MEVQLFVQSAQDSIFGLKFFEKFAPKCITI
jgi:hypothetical protein